MLFFTFILGQLFIKFDLESFLVKDTLCMEALGYVYTITDGFFAGMDRASVQTEEQ